MKRFLMWAGIAVAIPFGLLLLVAILLYIPPVQDFAVRKATAYASEVTGLDIRIGRLRLQPIADLRLQDFMVLDTDGDTVVAARQAVVDLAFTRILNSSINVEELSLHDVALDTKDMIAVAGIRGRLDLLTLKDDVELADQKVNMDHLLARGLNIDIEMRDTTVVDTTESAPLEWVIGLAEARIEDARIRFAMPGDSAMVARAAVEHFSAQDIQLDLGSQLYQVGEARLQAERAALWMAGDAVRDALPMRADSLLLTAKNIAFDGERAHLALPSMALTLPGSKVNAAADIDFRALEAGQGGGLDVSLRTTLAKADLLRAAGDMLPASFAKAYPDRLLHVSVALAGNVDHLILTQAEANLPGSIHADARGSLEQLMDSLARGGDILYNIQTRDIAWVRGMADGALDGILLPPMQLGGKATVHGSRIATQSHLREDRGMANLDVQLDISDPMTYDARLQLQRLQLTHFMPGLPLGPLSATASARGVGTDFFSRATRLEAEALVQELTYDSLQLHGTAMQALLRDGKGTARLSIDNPILIAQADVSTMLTNSFRDALCHLTFGLDLSRADLQALGLVEQPVKASMCLHMDGSTNLKDRHRIEGFINDIVLMHQDSVFRPEDVGLEAYLASDTTYATLNSGDMSLRLRGHTGYDRLAGQLGHFMDELNRQMEERRFDEEALTKRLPQIDMRLQMGEQNIVHDFLSAMGYGFEDIRMGINLDPLIGINGGGHIYKFALPGMQLDTIQAHLYQDSTSVRMDARVHNGRRNPHFTFDSRLNASIDRDGVASANLVYFDDKGRKGVDMGLQGRVANDTLRLHLTPLSPMLAYRSFRLNADNYIMLTKGNRIDADINLVADDGTGLKIYSSPNSEALQDLSVAISHFNLGELSSVVPYMPRLGGFLEGDAHLIQKGEAISVSTDLSIDNLRYEQATLGPVGLEAVYLPNADGTHFIDGNLLQMGVPVAAFRGSYTPNETDGVIDVDAELNRLPFALANGFIPDNMARLEGVAIGNIHVGGSTSKPSVDGLLTTSGLKILSDPYSLNLRVEDDTITITDSQLNLDRINIYSTGATPFTMDGTINFSDTERITVNTTMAAHNFELINAPKSPKAIAYGKVFVDFSAMLRGTLDDLNIKGKLGVLGSTDVTYLLTDSPLTTTDHLSELVEFVDFTDTLYVAPAATTNPQHLNISMSVNIADAAVAHCLLSPDGSSYVDVEGGGDLLMTYSPDKDLQLNGRYTINRGMMKYTMMVIPLKEFVIKSGSYVEFRGPLMNPSLNLSASERVRTTITENEQPRSVNFDVGMNITRTLQDLGLEFTLEAPEDSYIQNELSTMSPEQRGRLAVTMLATGMYINDAGSLTGGGVTGQNALNSFLQSQISNITNKALKSVDISMGVEQGTNAATGATTTDYSFRFAKRFWGNRISVIVGGKVSTGENATNTGQSMIDNISIEYRLDQGGSRYVNVFYDKNYESLLDGEITEMGAGLVLRRKTERVGDLFLFRKKK